MAYERFWWALAAYEQGEDRLANALLLFESLFDHYSWEAGNSVEEARLLDMLKKGEEGKLHSLALKPFVKKADKPFKAWLNEQQEISQEQYRETDIAVGFTSAKPTTLPSREMVDCLRQIMERGDLPDTSYKPDSDKQLTEEEYENLAISANIHGSALLIMWLRSDYADDIQLVNDRLIPIIGRLTGYNEEDNPIISLSLCLDAEAAFQRGDYATALTSMAGSLMLIIGGTFPGYFFSSRHVAPWFSIIETQGKESFEMLKSTRRGEVKWPKIAQACNTLSNITSGEEQRYWIASLAWTERELTLDELHILYEDRMDAESKNRLRIYFFPGKLWDRFPNRAQEALISADRQMFATGSSRRAGILNELRIATEEVLHRYLWLPVSEWAEGQGAAQRRFSETLAELKGKRLNPGLDDFVQLLYTDGVKDYLRSVGVDDEGVRFLTKETRTANYLKALQGSRNTAEHGYGYAPDPHAIRALYAEALGVGRKGVLPEMLRLLAPRPKPTVR